MIFIFLSDGNSLGRGFESGHFTSPKVPHTRNADGPVTMLTFRSQDTFIKYGTAGFRTKAELLDHVLYRFISDPCCDLFYPVKSHIL